MCKLSPTRHWHDPLTGTHSHDSNLVEALAARRVGVPEGGGGALRLGLDVQRHQEDDRDKEAEDHREECRERNFEADRAAICRGAELCQRGNGVSGGCISGGCVSGGCVSGGIASAWEWRKQRLRER